ncbi:MAG: hypothetical protein O7B99_11785, partial [Planctomycetota bacterium]|nr:hypothetical protein [Planctomycetota bacterium]
MAGAVVLDLTPRDVRTVTGAHPRSEQMSRWGNGWARNDHVLFFAQGPGARATVDVHAPRAGSYRVRVDYTAAPAFGVVELAVNGRAPFASVDLFATRVGLHPVVRDAVVLDEGPNAFAFAVVGSNPVATDHHFAIDRITLVETAFPSRSDAVDRAVAWILAHPADSFDGGRDDVCLEIVALQRLAASRPHLLDEVRARIGRLNALRGGWVMLAEYETLIAATHVARGLGLDLEAYAAMEDGVRSWAPRPYNERTGLRPAFLCAYLRRLEAETEPCGLGRSALAGAGTLVQRMAGSFDPRVALVA